MSLNANPGKKLVITVNNTDWLRYPVKTRFIGPGEKIEDVVEKYILPLVKESDIVVFGEKIISLAQNRVIYKKDIIVGCCAKILSRFVKKTPYGFSVGNPLKMQVAINTAGLGRILLAGFCGCITKLFGVSGVFYRIAGNQISRLDGFYGEAFPLYAEMGILGSENPDRLCEHLKEQYGFSAVVADINDLGGNIIGKSPDLQGKDTMLLNILKDNPAGQGNEQTPIIIIRKKTS